jgi:hypothetical protein
LATAEIDTLNLNRTLDRVAIVSARLKSIVPDEVNRISPSSRHVGHEVRACRWVLDGLEFVSQTHRVTGAQDSCVRRDRLRVRGKAIAGVKNNGVILRLRIYGWLCFRRLGLSVVLFSADLFSVA